MPTSAEPTYLIALQPELQLGLLCTSTYPPSSPPTLIKRALTITAGATAAASVGGLTITAGMHYQSVAMTRFSPVSHGCTLPLSPLSLPSRPPFPSISLLRSLFSLPLAPTLRSRDLPLSLLPSHPVRATGGHRAHGKSSLFPLLTLT